MSREQLLQELMAAFEQLIATATEAAQRGVSRSADSWGPREVIAHMAGWEVIATVHVPSIAAGMAPLFNYAGEQHKVLNEAINATFVTMIGDQPFATICDI